MRIETVTPHAVSLRIQRAELNGRETLSEKEAHDAVNQALLDGGQAPWAMADIRIFPRAEEILILARPRQPQIQRFRFRFFHNLLAAMEYLPDGIPSDVLFFHDAYELLLYTPSVRLPNALYEFGGPMPCTEAYLRHLMEQGEMIAEQKAVALLRHYFF